MRNLMIALCAMGCALPLFAKVELGTPFTDHAVLQRGMKVPVWGTAEPGETVTVKFAGQEKTAKADEKGAWRVDLDPMEASKESRVMSFEVKGKGEGEQMTVVKDVLVGEVWFASGQSNMSLPLCCYLTRFRDANGSLLREMTRLPYVRHCKSNHPLSTKPAFYKSTWWPFVDGKIQTMFSALAFYYARELYLALDVPIGIVDASQGGTGIDAWTPRCGYEGCDPSIKKFADYKVVEKAEWTAATNAMGVISSAGQQPTVLYNAMVASWAPMAMRGFIWYQGCHNAENGESKVYTAKLHALYNGWAKEFENADLKMYLAQLAPYSSSWMGIIAAQNKFVKEEPHAALSVLADVGNFDDIHPNAKEIVAKRLAVHALKRDYGFRISEDDSPVLREATFADGKATLKFDHVKQWYVYSPKATKEVPFEVAGSNGVWKAAKIVSAFTKAEGCTVDGDTLELKSDEVQAPVRARYMGRSRTTGNLYNQVNLPLGPFETE